MKEEVKEGIKEQGRVLKREVKEMRREFNDSEERWGKEREELRTRVKELEEKTGILESRGVRKGGRTGRGKGLKKERWKD